ncbi:MAG: HD domain-containing protein [Alphaproteobacteria bacterium]|nr:HD domain-containing protein [Alphaproteobacteria bacterium]
MKIYQVGGAVRDKILQKTPNDIDYVVVGSTVEQMKQLGFIQVGKGFPVFLHPQSKEEYALARKEIKTGDKHTDFEFVFTPDITLLEDLERRDFTCNAIAYDEEKNEFIDYFNGLEDIKNKVIRHINSEHFVEDPLRVLRMCRFAAQLDFEVDNKTLKLCSDMVKNKMLNFLSPERIWQEFEKAYSTGRFYRFVELMHTIGALKQIMPEIDRLFYVKEYEKYHPEGNTGGHTLNALKFVAGESAFVQFAVLVHDVGKALTPIETWPKHKEHELLGLDIIKDIARRLKIPNKIRDFAVLSSKLHMKYYHIPDMRIGTLYDLVSALNVANKSYLEEYIKVCKADFESINMDNKELERKRFADSAELLRKANNILCHIKATDMPNFETLPKDENFANRFREYKIGILREKLSNNLKK